MQSVAVTADVRKSSLIAVFLKVSLQPSYILFFLSSVALIFFLSFQRLLKAFMESQNCR